MGSGCHSFDGCQHTLLLAGCDETRLETRLAHLMVVMKCCARHFLLVAAATAEPDGTGKCVPQLGLLWFW